MGDTSPPPQRVPRSRCVLNLFWGITVAAASIALVLYGGERLSGALPDPSSWSANHGPWWNEPPGDVLCICRACLLFLPLASLPLWAIAIAEKRLRLLGEVVALTVTQIALMLLVGNVSFWVALG